MKGIFSVERINNGQPTARFLVTGNVGQENRDKLTALGMTPATGITNCREKYITTQDEAVSLRAALIDQGII